MKRGKKHEMPCIGFELNLSHKSVDFIREVVDLTTRKKVRKDPETGFERDLTFLTLNWQAFRALWVILPYGEDLKVQI